MLDIETLEFYLLRAQKVGNFVVSMWFGYGKKRLYRGGRRPQFYLLTFSRDEVVSRSY